MTNRILTVQFVQTAKRLGKTPVRLKNNGVCRLKSNLQEIIDFECHLRFDHRKCAVLTIIKLEHGLHGQIGEFGRHERAFTQTETIIIQKTPNCGRFHETPRNLRIIAGEIVH